ncbi:MAG: ubiquinol oxidase subunit II [Sulfuriferula sp.]
MGALLTMAGCAIQSHGFLQPAGIIADAEKHLLIEVVLLMLIVVVPVLILTPLLVWRYRSKNTRSTYQPEWEFSLLLELLVWGIPALIVAIMGYIVWRKTIELDPYRALASAEKPMEIQVVGLDWKWLFIYPEQNLATVNKLVFPVDRPVHLTLTSDTVMLTLLIPRLVGQMDVMPGMKTQLNFQANHVGRYLGENTQYNGTGFAQQKFTVQALSPQEFLAWVGQVRAQGSPLNHTAYAKITAHDIPPHPIYFSSINGSLFKSIIARYHDSPKVKASAEKPRTTTAGTNHDL